MVTTSVDSFWTLCRKSQLLPERRLREVRRLAFSEIKGESDSDPRAAARMLVARGDLTRWQAGQLLAGRHTFVLGGYLLLERLGKGGMGSVYKARQLSMSRTVALKLLSRKLADNAEARARFVREMQSVAALDHPNIIAAVDAGQERGIYYLVMEYLPGRDLAEYLKQFTRLPVRWSCECVRQAALGLQHAHDHGFIHRDIKPSNLLVAGEGAQEPRLVKVLDLGMARPVENREGGLTQLGQVLGTPDYISPEQGRDSTTADIRSDIYSLGCTLFKLLTGEAVFQGETTFDKLLARMSQDARRVRSLRPEVPVWLDDVVARMVARNPSDRYQTPAEVARALDPALHTEGSSAAIPVLAVEDTVLTLENDSELREFLSHFSGEEEVQQSEGSEIDVPPVPCPFDEATTPAPANDAVELAAPLVASASDTYAEGDTPFLPASGVAAAPPPAAEPFPTGKERCQKPFGDANGLMSKAPLETAPFSPVQTPSAAAPTTAELFRDWKHPERWPQGPLLAASLSVVAAILVALFLAIPDAVPVNASEETGPGERFPAPRHPQQPEPDYFPWQGIPIAGLHALDFHAEESGSYELALRVQEAPRGGAQVRLDGRPLAGVVDLRVTAERPLVLLGQHRLAKGAHRLEIDLGGGRSPEGVRFADWRLMGPFDNSRGQGFATSYPPEKDLDPGKTYSGKQGREVRWSERPMERGQTLELTKVFPDHEQSVAYLQCEVRTDRACKVPLFLGSDDTLTVWLNGQTLLAKDGNRGCVPYSDQVELELKPGENRLLFKVCQGNGAWGFWWSDQPPGSAEGLLRFGLHVRRGASR